MFSITLHRPTGGLVVHMLFVAIFCGNDIFARFCDSPCTHDTDYHVLL